MSGIKVLFLDIDGVLNHRRYLVENPYGVMIDPLRMELLKEVITATGAKIVLTSSWRVHWHKDPEKCKAAGREINRVFSQYGLEIYDKTQVRPEGREFEIDTWLSRHYEVTEYAVVDDEFLCDEWFGGRFVRTSAYKEGLDRESADLLIKILNQGE